MAIAWLLDAPLVAGVLPTVVSVLGLLGAVYLVHGRGRRWWLRAVPISVAVGAAVAALAQLVIVVARPFPDPLPLRVLFWTAVAVAAASLFVAGLVAGGRRGRARLVLGAVALLLVVSTVGVKINAFYGYRPTLAAVLGVPAADEIDLASLPTAPTTVAPQQGEPLSARWRPPPDMPAEGKITHVTIPGTVSGFAARQALVYLPPAYLGSVRATLPVLVLIPGQPGGPQDWLVAGQLADVMNRFAAAHHGLAPVVVVPDAMGSAFGNPLCIDSRLGNSETYLAVDVPAWTAANLHVDQRHLTIGGFSFGGTCALQLAVRRPDVYPSFLDISGQSEPTLGDRAQTVAAAFGGDEEAFRRVNPLDEMQRTTFPNTAGIIAVGLDDTMYRPDAEKVAAAARAAGMAITLTELNGAHSWTIASQALSGALPWISGRTGLLPP
ncbi:alpha/beta hydrolase [Pseudonocardia sp. TRM90224]|uniref:alpha/beta hydrolase n=1 Tax=Pseudonocardia sp. TRM90224 TaxID=2812678 RepID=UPI001E2824C9|nr:alpha/beta hydrolase-fold protein [Pseudonocardia sp. TRM90224]